MADTRYYSTLTSRGKELEAESSAKGSPVIIQNFVIGDGNGKPTIPDPVRTSLINEVYRGTISSLEVSPEQANQFIAHLVIPASSGGFTVREAGLLTDAGELYAVANCAAIEKPQKGVSISLQFRLAVSDTAEIELNVATGEGLFLRQDANLSDLKDVVQARKNMDLKGAALLDVGDKSNTVAAGDDPRITNAVQRTGDVMSGDLVLQNLYIDGADFIGKRKVITNADGTNGTNGMRLYGLGDMYADIYHYEQPGIRHSLSIHVVGGGGDAYFEFWQNGEFRYGGNILATDGNIYGSAWGGWLRDYLGNFAAGVRLGAETSVVMNDGNTYRAPWGSVVTGITKGGGGNPTNLFFKPIQVFLNGAWITIGG